MTKKTLCFSPRTHLLDITKIDALIERGPNAPLPSGMQSLFDEAKKIWDDNENDFHFRDFVAADYHRCFQALALLRDQCETFLEFGSGLGVITSSAGLLGYEAYGIEIDPKLVRRSQELAEKYETGAEFSYGSFIPNGYEWTAEFEDDFFKTILDEQDAYEDIDMELRDFDLVYGFPWPGERLFFLDVMQKFGRTGSLFMTYDVREGIIVERLGE